MSLATLQGRRSSRSGRVVMRLAVKAYSFISLSVRAGEVFANREKALAWLETPNPSLQGRSPIEAANTEEGFEQADEILTRIEHGVIG